MIKKIASSGLSIHAYTVILEKISFFLINLYLIKKLSIVDLSIFTQLFIYAGMLTLFTDMGTSMLYVNFHKQYTAHIILHIRLFLIFLVFIGVFFYFKNFYYMLFLLSFIIDSLSKFPQYFQIKQKKLKVFYFSQLLKGILLISLSLYWSKYEQINLNEALLSLSLIYLLTSFSIVFAFFNTIVKKIIFGLNDYKEILLNSKNIFFSQLLFMVQTSLPLYAITLYFQEQLKEFRIYLMVYSIFQQFIFIGFNAIYPKIVENQKLQIEKKWLILAGIIFIILSIIAFLIKDYVWQIVFSEVAQTKYQNIIFLTIDLALPISLWYLFLVTLSNAKKEFKKAFVTNVYGSLASVIFIGLSIYFQSFILVLIAFIIYLIASIIYLEVKNDKAIA